jgi:hypothetical protein
VTEWMDGCTIEQMGLSENYGLGYPKFVGFSAFPLLELPLGGVSALWTYPNREVNFIE